MCDEDKTAISGITYDGLKLTCGSTVVKPCDPMDEVIVKIFKMACLALKPIVLYSEEKSPGGASGTPAVLTSTTYTVPVGGDGKYEIDYTFDATLTLSGSAHSREIEVSAYKNGTVINSDITRSVKMQDATSSASDYLTTTGRFFMSQITLVEGDVFTMRGLIPVPGGTITQAVCKLTKIGLL